MGFLLDRSRWLTDHGRTWVEAGVLSPEELDAIVQLEEHREATTSTPTPRIAIGVELTLYLSAVLVATGSTFVVARFWDRLGTPGRLAVAAAATAVGYGAATFLERLGAAAFLRLAAAVRMAGTAGAALGTGVLAAAAGAEAGETIALFVGLIVLVLGGLDWRNRERFAALLTTVVGVSVTAGAVRALLDLPTMGTGVIVWVTSAAVLTLALTERVHPAVAAALFAGAGMFVGATTFGVREERLGVVVTLVSAVLLLTAGLAAHVGAVTAMGVLQIAVTLPQALVLYVHGLGGALALVLLGLGAMVVVAARLVRRG